MSSKPRTRKAPGPKRRKSNIVPPADPIFGLIDAQKALQKKWHRLGSKLGNAQHQASETHGTRPSPLIAWRNYSAIGGSEIDDRREEFLSQPGADREQIEKEYLDAKERLAAAERAGVEWDHRVGLASLREQVESADSAERKAAMRLARTKPMTPAGAGALIAYVLQRERMYGGFEGWEIRALKTVAGALAKMEAA
jgi:hypothetical protein